ncbi:MAG: hypothetical protein ACETVR_02200 [Candidatus Bathyarchaeia archaeon]
MRKVLGFSLVFVLFLTLSMGVSMQVHGEEVSPLVKVHHNVEVREGGLILINDTFILLNPFNTTIEVEDFFVGFPSPFPSHIDYHAFYQWSNDTWITLASESSEVGENDTRGFTLTLPSPVRLEEGETLILRGVFLFSKTVSLYDGEFYASFPLYPSLPLNLSTCEVEVRLPPGAILGGIEPEVFTNSTIDGTYILNHNQTSLPPFQGEVATVMYGAGASSPLLVECESFKRVIDLNSPSQVRIRDTYTLFNLGSRIDFYSKIVPHGSFNIRARTDLSSLMVYVQGDEEGDITVYIAPKVSIKPGERWVFTVEYSLPFREYVERNEGGFLELNYVFLSNFSFTVRQLSVTVILPEGGEHLTSTPTPTVKKTGPFTQELSYGMENATLLDDLRFHLAYRYNPLWTAFRPTLWTSLLVLAVVGTHQLLFRKKREEREMPEERRLLRRFIELYEEKLVLSTEEEKLEEDRENRRISRPEYDRRIKDIESRSSKVEDLLRGVKDSIKQRMPQFGELLREIEVAEVEIETEKTNLRELGARLRARRLSRGAYRRLRQEYLRRIRRARSRIERAILSLRERVY